MKTLAVLLFAAAMNLSAAEPSSVQSTNRLHPKGFTSAPAKTYDDQSPNITNVPPVREITNGVYEIGMVRVHPAERTVSFPVVVNMNEGPMEYLIVTTYGKVHESVFRTEAQPFHVHTGMLLLGAKGSSALTAGAAAIEGPTYNPSKVALQGEPITVEFSWEENGKTITRSPLDFLTARRSPGFNPDSETPAKEPPPGKLTWVYNGSGVMDNRFIGQISGSIISLITDASALANNIAEGRENDDMWSAAPAKLPRLEKLVTATLRLQSPVKK